MITFAARFLLGASVLTAAVYGWRAHGTINRRPVNGYAAIAAAVVEVALIWLAGGWG